MRQWLKLYPIPIAELHPLLGNGFTGHGSTLCTITKPLGYSLGAWAGKVNPQAFLTQPPCTKLTMHVESRIRDVSRRHYCSIKLTRSEGVRFGNMFARIVGGIQWWRDHLRDPYYLRNVAIQKEKNLHNDNSDMKMQVKIEMSRVIHSGAAIMTEILSVEDAAEALDGLI